MRYAVRHATIYEYGGDVVHSHEISRAFDRHRRHRRRAGDLPLAGRLATGEPAQE